MGSSYGRKMDIQQLRAPTGPGWYLRLAPWSPYSSGSPVLLEDSDRAVKQPQALQVPEGG